MNDNDMKAGEGVPVYVRLYTMAGCAMCEWARQYLMENGVAFQEIVGGGDPVIEFGIRTITKSPRAHFPLLLFAPTKKWILGRDDAKYQRVVADVRARIGAGAPDAAAAASEPSGQPSPVGAEQASASA